MKICYGPVGFEIQLLLMQVCISYKYIYIQYLTYSNLLIRIVYKYASSLYLEVIVYKYILYLSVQYTSTHINSLY